MILFVSATIRVDIDNKQSQRIEILNIAHLMNQSERQINNQKQKMKNYVGFPI